MGRERSLLPQEVTLNNVKVGGNMYTLVEHSIGTALFLWAVSVFVGVTIGIIIAAKED